MHEIHAPTGVLHIDLAITEALDALGDDPAYEKARHALVKATDALNAGTTAQAHDWLDEALRLVDETCPLTRTMNGQHP